ncbi:lanthionine synthetase LanC family protein [Puia dinghuensis]|uniref:Protein kinase domain-containing protein n=1 Tax=Puia dinghuensis TaxID=1792502 RepID=A0A8J2XWG3_9BACT|nr:lanthionine synthetase LanC family protein [Puia dinghuensis]GGB23751.1 hypothetical protein GCM10011511_54510 [Puia dinghuensis]
MQTTFAEIDVDQSSAIHLVGEASFECDEMLNRNGLSYKDKGLYFQVGEITGTQGWVLHVSVIRLQFTSLINNILPLLISMKIPFQIPRTKDTVRSLLDGTLGHFQVGKILCIYIESEPTTLTIAKKLVELTRNFRGPAVPTDSFLGGTVYTRYEGFNPITKIGHNGHEQQYIYDSTGNLILDRMTIPFSMPPGVIWPFAEIAEVKLPVRKKLWNLKYKPLTVLKPDPKGRVIQGNYFKGPFQIKLCIIKEGLKNMWADEFGRDITDRLMWQYELYKDLSGQFPMPEIFDLFQDQDCTYLAMEFIKGDPLNDYILSIFQNNSWFGLAKSQQLHLIDLLLMILSITDKLHQKGYIHRDITPANFIINRRSQLFLIDMELCYSIYCNKPNPPFKLGTPGYISPEQMEAQTPNTKEDIYALGAFMIFIFTGIQPIKFNPFSEQFPEQLKYFLRNPVLAALIKKCLASNPEERPALSMLEETITNYRKELQMHPSITSSEKLTTKIDKEKIREIIIKAIKCLSNGSILSEDNVWLSTVKINDLIGYQPAERAPQSAFFNGLTGIAYLIGRAKRFGYDTSTVTEEYTASCKYLEDKFLNSIQLSTPGLYDGSAGIALALKEGIESGLLPDNKYYTYLEHCFQPPASKLALATGVSGQGLSLLHCATYLRHEFHKPLLQEYLAMVIQAQQSDGSWPNYRSGKKKDNAIGFAHGTAGILCFLIAYANYHKDPQVIECICKGLAWLHRQSKVKSGSYYWATSTKSKSENAFCSDIGLPGVALTFIKAYSLLNEPLYKKIAENALASLPDSPTHLDYTQANGLSGLGEVYLEASRVLGGDIWQYRLNQLANLFIHTFWEHENRQGYWSVNIFPDFEPELMTGTCGIIHFLMRCDMPDKIGHLLLDI